MEALEISIRKSEENPPERDQFGRDEYLKPEFSVKRLEWRRLVETVKNKRFNYLFRPYIHSQ